jgi:Zn-dependent peptidase ImmA (M78 family)
MVHNGKEILEFKASDYSPTHELQHYIFHQHRTQQALGTKKKAPPPLMM